MTDRTFDDISDVFRDYEECWRAEAYFPLPVEFDTQAAYKYARHAHQASNEPALRLSKLARSAINTPGGWTVLATYRLPFDAVSPLEDPCAVCGKPLKRNAVSAAGVGLHQRCLPGKVPEATAEVFRLLAEELLQVRTWKDVFGTNLPPPRPPRRKRGEK